MLASTHNPHRRKRRFFFDPLEPRLLLAAQEMPDMRAEVEVIRARDAAIVERAAARDEAITISIPDFVRGPGERVDLPPNTDAGLPIVLSDGEGVRAVDLSIAYDAALLEIVGAAVADDTPAGSGVVLNNSTPGLAVLTFYSPTDLPAGQLAFLKLDAVVPDTEFTRTLDHEHFLDLHDITISDGDDHEFPFVDVDALHTVAFRKDISVTSLVPTDTGFVAEFSEPIDAESLNLFDTESAGLGPADVQLVGAVAGPVSGSLLVAPSKDRIEFVKTGGPLVPDSYTVSLRSAPDGFTDVAGKPLDGDGDGMAGCDFTGEFVVEPPATGAIALSLRDFVRGPGEAVNIPANTASGIPLSISDGSQIMAIDLKISYDARLLAVTGAHAAEGTPAGSLLTTNATTPGLLIVSFASPTPLPAGPVVFANLDAYVPDNLDGSSYGEIAKLDIHSATVSDGADNEREVIDDDAIHLAAYFGDVSGNAIVNANDASLAGRVTVRLDTGFASTPLVDPLIAADISGNGRLNATDTSKIARHAAGLTVPEIPYRGNGTAERPVRWSGNGHYYALVSPPDGIRWTDARSAAEELVFRGTHGHLATINSAAEWDFVIEAFSQDFTWIGLTDEENEGTFRWVTGEPLEFTAWGVSPQEPNNAAPGAGEDYVHIGYRSTGVGWNDFSNRDNVYGFPTSYIVEFPVPTDSSSVVVPATSSIWLAGQPIGVEIFGNSAPSQSPVSIDLRSLSHSASLQFAVSGETTRSPVLSQWPLVGADGETNTSSLPGPYFHLSGALAPYSSLVGVFLDAERSRPAPERIDFSSSSQRSFGELNPALQQVFFVGDGLTGLNEGQRQRFMIPPNADTLYLGLLDSDSRNNVGQLTVTIFSS